MTSDTRPNILVVDDTHENLRLLIRMLEDHGYRGRPVTTGQHALEAVQAEPPDLILLDVSMPDMDGYEVCRLLKADVLTAEIPVLFISALTESEDKIRGLEAGAVDYIGKPFRVAEVLARIRTHLQLHRQQCELRASQARQRELEQLRDQLLHMVVHDMRSPLLALNMTLQVARGSMPNNGAHLLDDAQVQVRRLVEMVAQMLDISRLEAKAMQLKLEPVSLIEVAQAAVSSLSALAASLSIRIESNGPCRVSADHDLMVRVLMNLLGNAIKFARTEILVRVLQDEGYLRVEIIDDGPGIAPEHHKRIFEKYGQVTGPRIWQGFGLGLTFVKMAIEAHGGNVGVKSALGQGSTFWFRLPVTS